MDSLPLFPVDRGGIPTMPDYDGAGIELWKNSEEYNEALRSLRGIDRKTAAAERRLRGENIRRNKKRKKIVPAVRPEGSEIG